MSKKARRRPKWKKLSRRHSWKRFYLAVKHAYKKRQAAFDARFPNATDAR